MARLPSQFRLLRRLNWLLKGQWILTRGLIQKEDQYRWMQISTKLRCFETVLVKSLEISALSTPHAIPADRKLRMVDAVVK